MGLLRRRHRPDGDRRFITIRTAEQDVVAAQIREHYFLRHLHVGPSGARRFFERATET